MEITYFIRNNGKGGLTGYKDIRTELEEAVTAAGFRRATKTEIQDAGYEMVEVKTRTTTKSGPKDKGASGTNKATDSGNNRQDTETGKKE